MVEVREARPAELEDWDAHDRPADSGNVHQSRAWAAYRAAFGWRPQFLRRPTTARGSWRWPDRGR